MSKVVTLKPRILVVDGDAAVRTQLCDLLSTEYECVSVADSAGALAALEAGRFALVLGEPEMIPHVQRLGGGALVVAVDDARCAERAAESMRRGAFAYIAKPFDSGYAQAVIERALDHHALRQSRRIFEGDLERLACGEAIQAAGSASRDPLTGLPNRLLFNDRLTQALSLASPDRPVLAVVFLDIDRFKSINDTLGHLAGDILLRTVARRIEACAGEGDTVARFGSDEFALLLARCTRAEDAVQVARELLECLRPPIQFEDHELYVAASVGLSIAPFDGEDTQTLLKNAGAALLRAKQRGGNNYQLYTADMNAKALKQLSMEGALRRALDRQEFVLHYQPLVEAATGRIVGMEGLVRWQHPELGLVPPSEFIPLAEETGLIDPLGEWVLRTACVQNRRLQERGFRGLCVSVNLSPLLFRRADLVASIERVVCGSGLDPHYLELELTETSIMRSTDAAIAMLRALKAMGISVAIDDFGSGYSSLSYLKHLPIDVLKIDQSFVRDLASDPNDAAIVRAIIELAHNLHLRVKAEGVETHEQRKILCALNCDEMQGYFLGRPQTAEAFEALLRARSHARAGGSSDRPLQLSA
jgi:diguanylate cyclase (GGDEF)-like protein